MFNFLCKKINRKVKTVQNKKTSNFLEVLVARDRWFSLFLDKNLIFGYVFGVVNLEKLRKFEKNYCIPKKVIL